VLTEDLAIRTVKGNHLTIVREPLVSRLAEELEGLLNAAAVSLPY
jgi:thioesterase domain-containing protein